MILGVTGHRKFKFYGNTKVENFVYSEVLSLLRALKPDRLISGFALGSDQIAVKAALELGIPVTAAIPFLGQESKWNEKSKSEYMELLNKSDKIEVVSPGEYAAWKMHRRNEWIVDNSDELIAILDPNEKSGGTFQCVQYAKNKDKNLYSINPYASA